MQYNKYGGSIIVIRQSYHHTGNRRRDRGPLMDNLIEKTKEYVREFFRGEYSGHDYYHTIRVYELAKKIAEVENADIRIVSLAALLHDVDDAKISPDTYKDKVNAVAFLKKEDVSDNEIGRIVEIIDQISFLGTDSVVPSTIEGKCVQDADRLDALGAIGIARAFAYGGNHDRDIYDPDVPPVLGMTKEEYRRHESTSLNHFYEKLFLLKDMMNTATALKIADRREKYMRAYLDEFLREWSAEDC